MDGVNVDIETGKGTNNCRLPLNRHEIAAWDPLLNLDLLTRTMLIKAVATSSCIRSA